MAIHVRPHGRMARKSVRQRKGMVESPNSRSRKIQNKLGIALYFLLPFPSHLLSLQKLQTSIHVLPSPFSKSRNASLESFKFGETGICAPRSWKGSGKVQNVFYDFPNFLEN
jgi:hypothetical protein